MASVLIIATRRKVHAEAGAVARALTGIGGHTIHFLNADFTTSISLPAAVLTPDEGPTTRDRIKQTVLTRAPLRALALLRGILADRRRLRAVFDRLRPTMVVLFDDRSVRPDLVAARLAADRGLLVVLVPFAISSVEGDTLMRHDKPEFAVSLGGWRGLKTIVAHRWPGQVQGGLLFFNAFDTFVLAIAGIIPSRPWVQGGSGVDMICASGGDERSYLLGGGISPDRIAMTGQPSLDSLSLDSPSRKHLHDSLVSKYHLAATQPLVMCAVPQDAEHGLVDWDRHRELTDRLFAALARSGAAVVLSLHPRSKRSDYEPIARRYRLAIADEALASLLPAADLLVGTFSSTIRWAIGLGIPALVVDALGLGLDLYRDLEGVTILGDHAAFSELLVRFVADDAVRRDLGLAAKRGALRTGRVDGQASARFNAAILALLAREENDNTAPASADGKARQPQTGSATPWPV
jgi:hypothetical protein